MVADRPDDDAASSRPDDALTELRSELEAVERIPVHERVALFERANTTIARELASLDEV